METDNASFDPPIGIAVELEPGLRRIIAPNPSPMTFRGTNTYLVGTTEIAVIDPGPDITAHLDAIHAAIMPDQRITHILVTHAHLDHSPLARRLAAQTGAPVLGFGGATAGRSRLMQQLADEGVGGGEGVDQAFCPDILLADGSTVAADGWSLTALWTPGHMGNHLAFAWRDRVFTGDLVMGWSTSLISPPDGDISAFLASCERLKAESWRLFHPGHGAPITSPRARLDWLIQHRRSREAEILAMLEEGPARTSDIVSRIYADIPVRLHPAAQRNILAHLIDLTEKRRVCAESNLSANACFALRTPTPKKS